VGETAFCHVFEHGGRPVVYDVHTNRLLAVDPVLAAVLPLYGPLDPAAVARRLAGRHPAAAVHAAIAELERARREEGLFRAERPAVAAPAWTAADARALTRGRRHLSLSVSEDCNLRCGYCPYAGALTAVRPDRPRTMSPAVAMAAVADFLAASRDTAAPVLSFYGGEPLLAYELVAAVVAAVRRSPDGGRVRITVDTNGFALDRAAIVDLVQRERLYLQVSLDGPAAVHDRYRRTALGAPTHARIEANLTALLRADPSVADRLSLVATLAPPFDLVAVGEYFGDFPPFCAASIRRPPLLRVNRADLRGAAAQRAARVAWRTQLMALRDRYLALRAGEVADSLAVLLGALFDEPLIAWHHRGGQPLAGPVGRGGCCLPGVRRTHVRADGILQPCERVGQGLPLGTAATGLDARRLQQVREQFTATLDGACSDCWAVRLCRVCYSALAPDAAVSLRERCLAVREGVEATLRLFLDLRARSRESLQWLDRTAVE